MNLSKRTFLYSLFISSAIVVLVIGYFIALLPSLYVDYTNKVNFNSVKLLHNNYLESGNYGDEVLRNPSSTLTLTIPSDGNVIQVYNIFVKANVTLKDDNLIKVLDMMRKDGKDVDIDKIEDEIKEFMDKEKNISSNFEIDVLENDNSYKFEVLSTKVKEDSGLTILENNVRDNKNYYTNYVLITEEDNKRIITLLSTMTPQINEVRPIILNSLPTVIAISLVLIIIGTRFFSKKIVEPIEDLSNQAINMKRSKSNNIKHINLVRKDEIGNLANILNEVFIDLDKKVNELEEENKKQEVFLRASSHQLKTPVAASLLLVEGMINKVGKFKDTEKYLPMVKNELLSMRKIIDEVLDLHKRKENIKLEKINLSEIIYNVISYHEFEIKEKELKINRDFNKYVCITDGDIMSIIIDNLFSNALKHSRINGEIYIGIEDNSLRIINYGDKINQDILSNIFEPFTTSDENKGHGLGLYLVSYYSKLLNYTVEVNNINNGVEAIIKMH